MKSIKTVVIIGCVTVMLLGLTACGSAGTESAAGSQAEEQQPESSQITEEETVTESVQESSEEAEAEVSVTTEENDTEAVSESAAPVEETDTEEETEAVDSGAGNSETLVVFFSATGTTKGVAETIAEVTGADTYEILAKETYTDDDLNWHDNNSRTTHEQNDPACRPEIGSEDVSLDGYSTIYIGYPIWWGEEPRIMDTFVEKYNFDGITMIPFCTSGGSGIGRSGTNLAENAESGNWLDGERLNGNASAEEISAWIEGLQ